MHHSIEAAHAPAAAPSPPRPRAAVLGPLLTVVFLNSLGTGAVTNGVFFLAREAYGFGDRRNGLLGVALGATYIAGALLAGRAVRRLTLSRLSTRGVLAGVHVALAALACVPIAARALPGDGSWPIWVLVLVYGPLTGALWPIVEAYLAGGRRQGALRRAVGRFNIVWAGAIVVSYWAMAPLLEAAPRVLLAGLGAAHLLCLPLIARLPARPADHAETADLPHEIAADKARLMLGVFRAALVGSYVLLSVLSPYLAGALARTSLAVAWHTPLVSAWMVCRLASFVWMGRSERWHGRWATAAWGIGLLVAGFASAVAVTGLLDAGAGLIPLTVVSLGAVGAGMGIVYCGALYYAMELGNAEVDAGGRHEAAIGVGYTLGPALLLLALYLGPRLGALPGSDRNPELGYELVVTVSAIAVFLGLIASPVLRALRGRDASGAVGGG